MGKLISYQLRSISRIACLNYQPQYGQAGTYTGYAVTKETVSILCAIENLFKVYNRTTLVPGNYADLAFSLVNDTTIKYEVKWEGQTEWQQRFLNFALTEGFDFKEMDKWEI